ncbi:Histone acetyltransferase [Nymphaea thermarum]|nr:Histone acetyltransferase [Nymphaea thermarum]
MVTHKSERAQYIAYRPIRPSDLEALQEIHGSLFPIRYESQFFLNVVNSRDIISWAAVDSSRPDEKADELIAFVTARVVIPSQAEVDDILQCDTSDKNRRLVYILTLGVAQQYRNLGIASSLVREVINYASSIPACRAVYLHVIAYNRPAILFYRRMAFRCLRRLPYFYYINDQHFDAYLYAYHVNGGRSPCSALDLIVAVATYLRSFFMSLTTRLWKHGDEVPAWPKCKEANSLLPNSNRIIQGAGSSGLQCV